MTSVQATFAATLVDEWVRAGVGHAVVAPGSRSTPLALALDTDERLRVHVVLDERSASFMAVGIGRATGVPAVVLTTSGTATAECHAAVLEASHGCVPMIVCTADRPPELQGVGAPQTVDQVRLFGGAVRWSAEPGVADEAGRGTWRALAARSAAEATGARPGPVHLNLPFRDPLVGEAGELPPARADGEPWLVPTRPTSLRSVGRGGALLRSGQGVVVAGSLPQVDPEVVADFAVRTGWPVLADPLSGARSAGAAVVGAADALLRHDDFAGAMRPEVVLRIGMLPASKVLNQWLAASDARAVTIDPSGAYVDPDRLSAVMVAAEPDDALAFLAKELDGVRDPGWGERWAAAEAAAQGVFDAALGSRQELTEPGVARALVDRLPNGATLVASSSMPVRDVEWYGRPRDGLRVLANRGANGIDGVVSTAVGVALASDGPTALLIGDLAFLHDSGGLLGVAERDVDLTIVVVDNRGGGIFSFLPQAAVLPEDRFERLFGTPQAVDLASLAAVHGVPALRVADPEGLDPALTAALATPGPMVVVVPTVDRAHNVAVHDDLHAAVAQALDRLA